MAFTTRPELRGTFGGVASTHWLASQAGMRMLELDGTAADAAVAAGFTLQVVEPHLNGPGGEVPILHHAHGDARPTVICGQGTAPARATVAAFRELGLDLVPGTGLLAAVVPGAFDAWLRLLRDHGTLSLATVLAPAIRYAADGHPLLPGAANAIAGLAQRFREDWPTSAAVFLPRDRPPEANEGFRNPALAATYRRILDEAEAASGDRVEQIEAARRTWARGFVAEAIDRFCRTQRVRDTSGRCHGGFLTGDDMARWQAGVEAPVVHEHAGYTVCKPGPWSQGPVLLQQLALLDGLDLAGMDPAGPAFVHTVTEAAKLALADREAFYGDPAFADVPIATLLSDDHAAQRRALIGEHASTELRPGTIPGQGTDDPVPVQAPDTAGEGAPGTGEPTVQDKPGDTCHVDAVDRWGNAVSATPSGGWLQASPVIPELGFPLNTRAQMFWLAEDHPNALAPGKRPRTTLSASIAVRDGQAALAWGTPGGDYQDQWALTFWLRHVHHGLNLQEAIDAPMFCTDHAPASFYPRRAQPGSLNVEARFAETTLAELRERGHGVRIRDAWSLGRLAAAGLTDGQVRAAAHPRMMQGYAVAR
ncbi:gamma-glutamyltransferase family protein [Limimonas halophila]|uniref:gamma-glutamyltransferase family protein n=1 Tax=Limimonas halophila TaxID=1082479 RepID=UPI001FDEE81E|nr:gamma-glutamyltransferase [Limimonas halophila]